MSIPDLTGYIFRAGTSYWKVIGAKREGWNGYNNYPVIKCTKYGKEFQYGSNYGADALEKLFIEGKMTRCVLNEENVEVSTAEQASGVRKRRITHLDREIKRQLKELNRLLEQDGAPFVYEFNQVLTSGPT